LKVFPDFRIEIQYHHEDFIGKRRRADEGKAGDILFFHSPSF